MANSVPTLDTITITLTLLNSESNPASKSEPDVEKQDLIEKNRLSNLIREVLEDVELRLEDNTKVPYISLLSLF